MGAFGKLSRRIAEGGFAPQPRLPRQLAQSGQSRPGKGPGQLGRGHFPPQSHGLTCPKIGEINLALLLGCRFQGRKRSRRIGKGRRVGSRITRLTIPRAGRPVMTLVMTVESSLAWANVVRAGPITFDSGQRK
jgi:hypothetical protein